MNRIRMFSWGWAVAMLGAIGLGHLMTPTTSMSPPGAVDLEAMVPKQFGAWTYVPSAVTQVDLSVKRDGDEGSNTRVYDQVLMRTYRNPQGQSVMLALAWGRQQRQEVKIHRPELCYIAQGFRIESSRPLEGLGDGSVRGTTLLTASTRRFEPVIYWVRIGDTLSSSAWQTRLYILREGIAGRIPDGILVRTSQVMRNGSQVEASLEVQRQFLADLVAAVPPAQRAVLVPRETQRLALAAPR
ncbi:MAG: exosortase C-terminal domain/associated protein EpsI [Burkholderiales bacterium]|jgi:EpsI family protein